MAAVVAVMPGLAAADSGSPPAGGYVPVTPATKVFGGSIGADKTVSAIAAGGATTLPTNATAVQLHLTIKSSGAGGLIVYPAGDPTAPDSQNVSYGLSTSAVIQTTVGAKDEVAIHNAGSLAATVTATDIGYSTQLTATNIAPDAGSAGQVLTDTGTGAAWQTPEVTINSGSGLTGGGTIPLGGSSTLSVDPTVFQSRVSGACSGGGAISQINQDGTVSCASAVAAWSLTGNAGTPSSDFLGTSDNNPLNLDVNGQRAFELQPNVTSPNVIGGFSGNTVSSGVSGATISGGGRSVVPNSVTADFGTVAGGSGNTAGGQGSTASGQGNTAHGADATVLGASNVAFGLDATAMGEENSAGGQDAVALGGFNSASTDSAALGTDNTAAGTGSVALGQFTNDPSGDNNAFVWSDGTLGAGNQMFSVTGSKQFDALASGGFNMQLSAPGATYTGCKLTSASGWACSSDRNVKHAFRPISDQRILAGLAAMPIDSWSYKLDRAGTRHIGPTAQDFLAAFHIGSSPRLIGTLDEGGVALAGVQGVYRLVLAQQRQIARLQAQLATLERAHAHHQPSRPAVGVRATNRSGAPGPKGDTGAPGSKGDTGAPRG
jgi:hypothetical protein